MKTLSDLHYTIDEFIMCTNCEPTHLLASRQQIQRMLDNYGTELLKPTETHETKLLNLTWIECTIPEPRVAKLL